MQGDAIEAIESNVSLEAREFGRSWLNRNDVPSRPHERREDHRHLPLVRADVDDGHAGLNMASEESRSGSVRPERVRRTDARLDDEAHASCRTSYDVPRRSVRI